MTCSDGEMTGMDDWGELIGYSVQMRQRLHEYDPRIFVMSIPHLGATPEELDAAESQLGHPLDPLDRELLSYGNGWESFSHYTDLFGTEEIGQGTRWREELEMTQIRYFPYEGAERMDLDEPGPEELYLMSGGHSRDQFLLWRNGPLSPNGGRPVIWQAGEEIERYPDVYEWLRSVNAYLLGHIEEMEADEKPFPNYQPL